MKQQGDDVFQFGPFRLDPARRRLSRNGKTVTIRTKKKEEQTLTGKAFDVLLVLVKSDGKLVSRKDFEIALWEGKEISDAVLAQYITRIRKFLGDHAGAPVYIATLSGKGHQFIKPVRRIPGFKTKSGAEELFDDGLVYLYTFTTEDELNKAIDCFKQSHTYQPDHAAAYAAEAEAYIWLSIFSWKDPREALPEAQRLAKKALEYDPQLGDADAVLALANLLWHRNWSEAEKVFERVLRLNPMSQAALRGYALLLMANARFEDALRKIDRALLVNPKSFLNINVKCVVLYESGNEDYLDFVMQVTEEQKELKVDAAWYMRGLFYERAGWHKQAVKMMREIKLTDDQFLGHLVLAYLFAVAGERDDARKVLDKLKALSKERWVSPFHIALIELAGNPKNAKRYLNDAIEMHDPWACLLLDPRLKPLRTDPEFLDMFRRINLDPDLICKGWSS
jgi:DNA-binding winged helix-turn-helix (wHTH) protein